MERRWHCDELPGAVAAGAPQVRGLVVRPWYTFPRHFAAPFDEFRVHRVAGASSVYHMDTVGRFRFRFGFRFRFVGSEGASTSQEGCIADWPAASGLCQPCSHAVSIWCGCGWVPPELGGCGRGMNVGGFNTWWWGVEFVPSFKKTHVMATLRLHQKHVEM